jgi:hypothetical protein
MKLVSGSCDHYFISKGSYCFFAVTLAPLFLNIIKAGEGSHLAKTSRVAFGA